MTKHWRYLKYVLRHKWHVFVWCWRYGLLWAGIVHDLSKFHPREWFPYVDNFYGGPWPDTGYRGPHAWMETGTQAWVDRRFDAAWNHHQKRNPHHWQYWVLLKDDGGMVCLPMPDRYRREMLADWRGAGMAINGVDETRDWYLKNRAKMQLHPETRRWVERQLAIFDLDYPGREMTVEAQEPLYPPEWGRPAESVSQ